MTASAVAGPLGPTNLWTRALLWLGVPLCMLGIASTELWRQWLPERSREVLQLALVACLCAWLAQRLLRCSMATALLLAWGAALVLFAGPVPVAAVLLLGGAAIAVGGVFARAGSPALQCACGLALIAGVGGWLLPLPVHFRWSWLAACMLLVAWRWRALRVDAVATRDAWRDNVAAHPWLAAFAVLLLGLATTGCWLPTLQADDLAYHLRLPSMLVDQGRYVLDPSYQAWALSPWAGDVLQGIAQLLAGAEARGPLDAVWIAITAAGVWQFARALGGDAAAGWWSVALYASLPLTTALAGGMQTEAPTAALLAWLLATTALTVKASPRLLPGAILVGGLLGLKLVAALMALLVLPWAAARARPWPAPGRLFGAALLALAIGGSSYAYALWVSGNPVLPVLNGWFQSPYFAKANFDDPRWHSGFGPMLPWQLTFHSDRYMEMYPGGLGFALVALAGAWLLALAQPRLRGAALTCLALLLLPLLPMQYARYAYPAMVASLPLLVASAMQLDVTRARWILPGLCLLNLAFQCNASWILRNGAVGFTMHALGRDAPLYALFAPERGLLAAVRAAGPRGNVLYLHPDAAFLAELGDRGRTVNWYAPRLAARARAAQGDPTGARWTALLARERISDVITEETQLGIAQKHMLQATGATERGRVGALSWWQLPPAGVRR